MSYDEAEKLMDEIERWEDRKQRRNFINRMEHKLYRKERRSRH